MATRFGRWALAVLASTVVIGCGVRRCDPVPVAPPTDFGYGSHVKPRVFVMHEPLVPAPSSTLSIRIAPEIEPPATVDRAVAVLRTAPTGPASETDCAAQGDGTFRCTITLDSTEGERFYSAYVDLSTGDRVASRGQYRFSVLASLPGNALVAVRVPVKPLEALDDTYRIDTAFVSDVAPGYTEAQHLGDVHAGLFAGILADPVYRWRDVHLGFWLYTRRGVVSSYYSGLDTRCGKNPWPGETAVPAALGSVEVVGVLHRRTSTADGIEGAGTAPASVAFRDCAGELAKRAGTGSFSATGGLAASPAILKHEFAHAAFGVGDEYREDQSTREVAPAIVNLLDTSCCCSNDGGTTTVPGGGIGTTTGGRTGSTFGGGPGGGPVTSTLTCVAAGGGFETRPALGGSTLPSCTGFTFPATCGASPDNDLCPSLLGRCVLSSAWLGATPATASTLRPNVFTSQAECEASAQKAADHPAVENPASSLGTCRVLCGPSVGTCPCAAPGAEFWIVDIDPLTTVPRDDAMSHVTAALERHGGTCQWCVETALCVRWHRARGDTADQAWAACDAPPKGATMLEALAQALAEFLRRLIGAILNVFGF